MPTEYKILGQAAPADTNNADLFTVASSKYVLVSTLAVCNVGTVAATFRAFATTGASGAASNAVAYDVSVAGNDTLCLTLGMTFDASDKLIIRSGTPNALTFTAFGSIVDV